ncbi:MAG TPA: GtrA family protein [Azospirillum sp.]|nr:GtrA family protein [Azospirillum sp.]
MSDGPLLDWISGLLTRLLGPRLGRLAYQFGKFGLVGVIGMLVDSAVLYALLFGAGLETHEEWGFLIARIPSFLAAATATWALNRSFTFKGAHDEPLHRQWAKFIAANSLGGVINYLAYAGCIAFDEPFTTHPILAVAVGSLAGMVFNFTASKKMVFKGV